MRILLLSVGLLFLAACKKSEDSSAAPNTNSTTNWVAIKQNASDTVSVQNGYLYLSTKYSTNTPIGDDLTTFKKIKGDFELRIQYSAYQCNGTSGTSAEMGFSISDGHGSSPLIAGILTNNAIYQEDTVVLHTVSKSTINKDGEFYAKRVSGDFVTWMRAGADTVKLNKTSYSTADLSVGISIGSFDNTATHTSVHIDDFTIIGGGGDVLSDPFTENNITVY